MTPREPGLYPGVPMGEYLAWPGASKSRLWTMHERSPAHARYEMDHPSEPTEAQRIGTATHMAVLQPDLFTASYVRAPEGDRRTKAVREKWAALMESHQGVDVLKPSEYDLCLRLRDAVLAHPIARRVVEGQAEASATWEDPETGVLCRGRFDLLSDRAPAVVDLKTARDASPAAFERAIYTHGYHVQGAMYLAGACALGLPQTESFIILALEKIPPYCIAVYDLEAAALAVGAEQLRRLLLTWRRCEESGEWPGYDPRVTRIGIPEWAFRREER